MQPLFSIEEEWLKFKTELEAWEGTPYRHYQKAKKYGADCGLFTGQALVNIGVWTKLSYIYYPRDWQVHGQTPVLENLLFDNFDNNLNSDYTYEKIKTKNFLVGDICVMSLVKRSMADHLAIYLGNDMIIHGLYNNGIFTMDFNKWWKLRTRYVVRIFKE
jgi:cell wall-associated NlpC family hydrolase